MENLNDLKALWQTANTTRLPTPAAMLRQVKSFRNRKITNKLIVIGVSVGVIIIMIMTYLTAPPLMLTTRLGMVLTVACCVILGTTNIRSIGRFIKLNDCSNLEFIAFLEQTRRNQLYFHQKTQVAGMALSTAGLALYFYEFVYQSPVAAAIAYTLIVIWSLFLWLYLRPRNFKRQSEKLNATLERLKKIENQLHEK